MKTQKAFFYHFLLVATAFIWGVSFLWVKDALNAGLDSSFFLFLRYLLASLLWLPVCAKELRQATGRQILMGALVGVFLYAAMLVQTVALNMTTPSNSAFITTSYVVLTPFAAWLIMGQKPRKKVYACALLCLLGLYVLTMTPGQPFVLSFGDGLTLLAALLFAFQITFLYRFTSRMPVRLLTFLPLATTCLCCLATALATGSMTLEGVQIKEAIFPTILVVLMATIAAGYMQTVGQTHVVPSRCAIIFSLESVFACLSSVVMGYEPLTLNLALGGLIVVCAVMVSEYQGKRKGEE